MGRAIHHVFQRRDGVRWVSVPSAYGGDHHYDLYDWLGLGNELASIAPLRGLPPDFQHDDGRYKVPWENQFGGWILIGEWGHSWLLASEILATEPPKVVRTIRASAQGATGDTDDPQWLLACESWCDPIRPPDRIRRDAAGVAAEWDYDFADNFRYFTDEVRRMQETYGEVRLVFGFS